MNIHTHNTYEFNLILTTIRDARHKAYTQIKHINIELYWNVGKIISHRVQNAKWGKGVVTELAKYITDNEPTIKGFSDKNIWRMKQFYETYQDDQKLATLWREIPWSQNRTIMTLKNPEEREFYLRFTIKEKYSVRELERQIASSLFERTLIGNQKLSTVLRELHPAIDYTFKDSYSLEFLGLPIEYNEGSLQTALIQNMKKFILELGRDFIFIDDEYRLQVGNSDYFIDLLF